MILVAATLLLTPAVASAERSPLDAISGARGPTYLSPTYGFVLTWEPWWQLASTRTESGVDEIELSDGLTRVRLTGRTAFGGDPKLCLDREIEEFIANSSVRHPRVLRDERGELIARDWGERSYAVFSFLRPLDNESLEPTMAFLECRALIPGTAVLSIRMITREATFAIEAPLVSRLLDGLVMPDDAPEDQ
jgi:hypothetical protein